MQQQTADQLLTIVTQWRPRLQSLADHTVRHRPAPDRWSIAEVVGHLVDSANNNHQRFVRAQFVTALTFAKYEQNEWVRAAAYHSLDWLTLIELWASYNTVLAHLIRQIPDDQWSTPCTITPYETCDLRFLVSDYVTHLQHHLDRIAERTDEDAA